MSQERGQRSIRSFFSPIERPTVSAVGSGDGPAVSPNENVSHNAVRTPVSSQKRASAARAGIHIYGESPVSSRKQPADQPAAKRMRQEIDLSDDSEDRPERGAESPISRRASATATSVLQTPTSTARRFASTPIASAATAASPATPLASRTAATGMAGAGGGDEVGLDSSEWPPKDPKYRFLWPEYIRDASGKRPDDPDYDPTTLRVPADFLNDQTATQRQWWAMKSKCFDTVLFFKVGKFYELFHMDSLIGIEELNLSPMSGSRLHSGFPEKSIQKYMDILRERGYRVARVEQTESAAVRDERVRTGVRETNVVNREICQIVTPGTAREVQMDGDHKYLMSLCQVVLEQEEQKESADRFIFGVCFTDTTVGRFSIGQFTDDRCCSRLRSLLAHYPPVEILTERRGLSTDASSVISMWLPSAIVRPLIRDKQFYSAARTLKLLHDGRYFESALPGGQAGYPDALMQMLDPADPLMQTPLTQFVLAVKALGGMLYYLKQCLIDEELLTMRLFERFVPADVDAAIDRPAGGGSSRVHMPNSLILDSLTLNHLDIFDSDFGVGTSLFGLLNHTSTRFGQRMLRFWISYPLTCISAISDRLNAIDDLSSNGMLVDQDALFAFLKKMPDLERLLNFVHTQGIRRKNDHPDSRAQLFEEYDKKKIQALSDLIASFYDAITAIKKIRPRAAHFKSTLLKSVVTLQSAGGQFPDIEKILNDFASANDLSEARQTGKVRPDQREGSEYAEVNKQISAIDQQLQSLLGQEVRTFGPKLKYSNSGKKKFLMEAPADVFNRVNPGSRCKVEQKKKNSVLFYIPEVEKLLPLLQQMKEKQEALAGEAQRLMFGHFAAHFDQWNRAVKCIATLDVLLSLTKVRSSLQAQSITMTRPEFIECSDSEPPVLHIREGKHPILAKLNPHFVSNDLSVDKLMIVTGPNMGGKSTLMRQTGLIVIMAQIGSFVPAAGVRMTPVDRVFTRLGAMDRIAEGESTFFVELSETSTILRHATRHSLVLLDELGRGTSTHDGTAVAYAVVHALSQQKRCRTLFSTHYHNLVDEFAGSERVSSCHMDCRVPSEEAGAVQEVTFLYRVAEGNCPKSHGFNVARKAGLPDPVILQAQEAAASLERRMNNQKTLTRLMSQLTVADDRGAHLSELRKIVIQMKEVALSYKK